MGNLTQLIDDLVAANRILAVERIVDAFGHVSARHPDRSDRFLLSSARPPEAVATGDIMEFTLEGEPPAESTAKLYLERFIHAAIYRARPDVQSVIHSHSRGTIPFGITGEMLSPVMHSCATIGREVSTWDSSDKFGETDLLIANMAMGNDLAAVLGGGTAVLMRGHGSAVVGASIREAVYTSVFLDLNAELQFRARQLGPVKFLSAGEIDRIAARLKEGRPGEGFDRSWEYWCRRANIPFRPTVGMKPA